MRFPLCLIPRRQRLAMLRDLLEQLECWEREGDLLLSRILELSAPDDPAALEARRIRSLLDL